MNDTDGHLFPEYVCETEKNASQNKSNIELIYHKYPKEELQLQSSSNFSSNPDNWWLVKL